MAAPQAMQQEPWPVYDLFLDIPHPAASSSCPPALLIGPVSSGSQQNDARNIEQELSKNLPHISRFAFPEYDIGPNGAPNSPPAALNRYDRYILQNSSFQDYTFSMQLQSGVRVHGHVRRYLPCHHIAKSRYDVGRRGERALVILTRATGADTFYASILKTMEAIFSLHNVNREGVSSHDKPHEWFLQQIDMKHRSLSTMYATTKNEKRGIPMYLSICGLEFGDAPVFTKVDFTHFFTPTCILHSPLNGDIASFSCSSILPLLRRLGVAHTLRLMSAMLSERRVVLVSSSPTRLANCCRSAISILAQGMLHWQHIYIPVLPPHLREYLAAPVPYIIGVLSTLAPLIDRTDGLGEVLIINLDKNAMEVRGIQADAIQKRIPDLFMLEQMQLQQQMASLGQSPQPLSATEYLAQDLVSLLREDKKILFGESIVANVGEQAAKATKAVKSTFLKLRDQSRKYLSSQRSSEDLNSDDGQESTVSTENEADTNTMAPEYIYIEGSRNEAGERDARIAFASFFLSMYGNMKWYLTGNPGQVPQFDKNKFLHQKRSLGDHDNTPMGALLTNFVDTQMMEEFVNSRVKEIVGRLPITNDAPLFLKAFNHLRQSKVDFSILNVQRTANQIAHANESPHVQYYINLRKDAMLITSKKTYEGDYNKAVADLVEKCRESASALFDVMSVIWMRIRDSKGMNWKHALNSLLLLKSLLFHGPLAAVAEATDGFAKIRSLMYYKDNMRTLNCQQIRTAAETVYNLLVDRAKLFSIRRVCANRRRTLAKKDQGRLTRDSRLKITIPFKSMHPALYPGASNRSQIAPAPVAPPQQRQVPPNVSDNFLQMQSLPNQPSSGIQAATPSNAPPPAKEDPWDDLLGLGTPPSGPPTSYGQVSAMPSQHTSAVPSQNISGQDSDDLLGIFGSMSVSGTAPAPSIAQDPFAGFASSYAMPAQSAVTEPGNINAQQNYPSQAVGAGAPPQSYAPAGVAYGAQQTQQQPYQQQPNSYGAPLGAPQPGAPQPGGPNYLQQQYAPQQQQQYASTPQQQYAHNPQQQQLQHQHQLQHQQQAYYAQPGAYNQQYHGGQQQPPPPNTYPGPSGR